MELSRKDKLSLIKVEAERARRHLMDFGFFTDPSYEDATHLRLIASKLEAVERGEIKKLIIEVPPRHGKTELTSKKFTAWALGRNPNRRIIITSYSASLAENNSRCTRNIVEDKKYSIVFPQVKTCQDSRAVDEWNIADAKGGMIAAGVGGSITGYGADIFIIDDPVKNQEEAESEVRREMVWGWYQSVVRTRLEPRAAQIIIMTRWHQKDLVGKILEEQKDWDVVHLPATAKGNDQLGRAEGAALWPQRYDVEALASIKHDVGSRVWYALYDGSPVDPESALIKRHWIQYYEHLPLKTKRYGGIDTATSKKTAADNTSLVDVCKDMEGFLLVDDVFLDHISVTGFAKFVSTSHKEKKYRRINLELNNAGEAIKQRCDEVGREDKTHPPVTGITTDTDKVVRLMEYQHLIENGTIRFRSGNPRVAKLIDHLVNFSGKESDDDDDIDALGQAIKAALQGDRDLVHII
jgi:predicted phage terminase large subunit-like protein